MEVTFSFQQMCCFVFNAVRIENPAFQRQEQENGMIKRSVSSPTFG
jgi:hypothetical protein